MTGLAAKATVQAIPWRMILGGALAIAFLALLAWAIRVNDLRDRWHRQYQSEHVARLADRSTYERAQAEADAKNKATLNRVRVEQEAINERTSRDFQTDLARLRAELGKRLSQGGTAAPQGASGTTGASPLPDAAGGADAETVCIPSSLYVFGAETELQLDHLQRWISEQLKVDPNK